jgi:hypothetical protein
VIAGTIRPALTRANGSSVKQPTQAKQHAPASPHRPVLTQRDSFHTATCCGRPAAVIASIANQPTNYAETGFELTTLPDKSLSTRVSPDRTFSEFVSFVPVGASIVGYTHMPNVATIACWARAGCHPELTMAGKSAMWHACASTEQQFQPFADMAKALQFQTD